MKLLRFLIGTAMVAVPAAGYANIQPTVRSMVEAAITGGNETEIATVVKFAKRVDPAGAAEIDKMVEEAQTLKTRETLAAILKAGMFDRWDGQADVGGSRTTGTSDTIGLTAGINLRREGIKWNHAIRVRGDYQKNAGEVTREALLASYEPNYKVNERLFIYGLGQFERDPFLGFYSRISLSTGIGYRVINEGPFLLDVNAGPAYRATRFVPDEDMVMGEDQQSLAARGSLGIRWTLAPTVKLTNDTAVYVESFNSTVATTTALDARIIGALTARLSYAVQYESSPPEGRQNLDTVSRASLVYDF